MMQILQVRCKSKVVPLL